MEFEPKLIPVHVPKQPVGVVLVLHGGAERGDQRVSPTQLSVLRMVPIAREIARRGRDLAVFRLLNARRGWGTDHTPVDDARWALDEIADELGQRLPACLVGHSLGGRAALLTAGESEVRGAVALAPWVYPTDVAPGLEGQRLLIVHGDRDRVARLDRAQALAAALSAARADVRFVTVPGGTHAMLRHHAKFTQPTLKFVLQTFEA